MDRFNLIERRYVKYVHSKCCCTSSCFIRRPATREQHHSCACNNIALLGSQNGFEDDTKEVVLQAIVESIQVQYFRPVRALVAGISVGLQYFYAKAGFGYTRVAFCESL